MQKLNLGLLHKARIFPTVIFRKVVFYSPTLNIICFLEKNNIFLRFCLCIFDLFDLILYVSSTIFQLNRDGSSWVEPVLS